MLNEEPSWLSKFSSRQGVLILIAGFVWLSMVDMSFGAGGILVNGLLGLRGDYYGIFGFPLLLIYLFEISVFSFLIFRLLTIARLLARDFSRFFGEDGVDDDRPDAAPSDKPRDKFLDAKFYGHLLLSSFTMLALLWLIMAVQPLIPFVISYALKR
jgi:hypothetical protein